MSYLRTPVEVTRIQRDERRPSRKAVNSEARWRMALIGNYSFPATGITEPLHIVGRLEGARRVACHEDDADRRAMTTLTSTQSGGR